MANDGDLSCLDLEEIEQTLNQTWTTDNSFEATRSVVKDDTIQALIRNMTADFEAISTRVDKKFPGVEVRWIEDCPIVTQACDVDCAAPTAGIEFGANCVSVDIDQCLMARELTIDNTKLWTTDTDFRDIVARAIYRADQALAEAMNVNAINAVNAASDTNLNLDTLGGQVTPAAAPGACTTMTPAVWAEPVQYLASTIELNNFTNPYFISGGGSSFFQTVSKDNLALGLGPVVSGLTTWNGWPVFFDIRQLDITLAGNKTFIVNRGEFAVLNAYSYPMLQDTDFRPGKGGEYVAYRLRSPILSEFYRRDWYHDVVYTRTCKVIENTLRDTHTWEIITRFKIQQSPKDCDGHGRVQCLQCA